MTRLTLRLPNSLHEQLRAAAKREGVSLNQYVVYTLAQSSTLGLRKRTDEEVEAQTEAFHSYLEDTPRASEEEVRAFLEARTPATPDVSTESLESLQSHLKSST